jgi:hypothetical protein
VAQRTLLVLSSDPDGPVVRHRWTAFSGALARAGVALDVCEWPKDPRGRRRALARARSAAGVVVSSRLLAAAGARAVRRASRRMAFDFDDALPYRDSGRGATPSPTRWRRFRRLVRAADRVFAGNAYLADLAAQAGREARVLPTVVDVPESAPSPEPPDVPCVFGWIGTRSTIPYLEARFIVFSALVASGMAIRVRVVADADPRLPPGIPVERIPWTLRGWRDALAAMHVGVAPLPDDPWTRGKCGLKVLQMLSLGRPVVASAVGVQREQIVHGTTGYLGADTASCLEHLFALAQDGALRRRMGSAAREDVRSRWSVARWAPAVVEEVERLLA